MGPALPLPGRDGDGPRDLTPRLKGAVGGRLPLPRGREHPARPHGGHRSPSEPAVQVDHSWPLGPGAPRPCPTACPAECSPLAHRVREAEGCGHPWVCVAPGAAWELGRPNDSPGPAYGLAAFDMAPTCSPGTPTWIICFLGLQAGSPEGLTHRSPPGSCTIPVRAQRAPSAQGGWPHLHLEHLLCPPLKLCTGPQPLLMLCALPLPTGRGLTCLSHSLQVLPLPSLWKACLAPRCFGLWASPAWCSAWHQHKRAQAAGWMFSRIWGGSRMG